MIKTLRKEIRCYKGKSGIGGGGGKSSEKIPKEKVYGGEFGTITESNLEKLVDLGAGRWIKGDKDRLYLNEAAEKIAGLEIERYKSGNISYAEFDGEKISNSRGRQAVYSLSGIYIDMSTGKVHNTDGSIYSDKLLENIKKYIT